MGEVRDVTRYFLVPPSEIAYVGFIVHAYEGLAVVRTLDPGLGLIEMLVAPDLQGELEDLMKDLSREFEIREVSRDEVASWDILEEGSELNSSVSKKIGDP